MARQNSEHEMLPLSSAGGPADGVLRDAEAGDAQSEQSPWRKQETLIATRDVRIKAMLASARGASFLGIDKKQWAWIVLHSGLFTLLCSWDTYLSVKLRGALDFRHFSWPDTIYMAAAFGIVVVTGLLYNNLYASDPGWVTPGDAAEDMQRPVCQYCGVRPPLRSRHCFLTGQCVVKYDHFCDLLATPVGERNHRRFWAYLLLQSFVCLWGLLIVGAAVGGCLKPSALRTAAGGACWTLRPVRTTVLLFVGLFLLALMLLFGSLWALHTYLLCTAQTTYEVLKGIGVPYLSLFYATYNGPHSRQLRYSRVWPEIIRRMIIGNPPPTPFSQGLAKNAEIFFFADYPYPHKYHALL